jgi:hypothetical protein
MTTPQHRCGDYVSLAVTHVVSGMQPLYPCIQVHMFMAGSSYLSPCSPQPEQSSWRAKTGQTGDARRGIICQMQNVNLDSSHHVACRHGAPDSVAGWGGFVEEFPLQQPVSL